MDKLVILGAYVTRIEHPTPVRCELEYLENHFNESLKIFHIYSFHVYFCPSRW
jgi:hypothetical protein